MMMGQPFMHLALARRYEVIKAFTDFDRTLHPVGETWIFLGHNFLPYDDGLTLWALRDGREPGSFRMQWRPEEQGGIIDNLADYIQPAREP